MKFLIVYFTRVQPIHKLLFNYNVLKLSTFMHCMLKKSYELTCYVIISDIVDCKTYLLFKKTESKYTFEIFLIKVNEK